MPPPALVPVLSYDASNNIISNISLVLDATVLRCWRDTSEYGTSDPNYPYYAADLKIHSFRGSDNIMLARYTGGKLKKDALYQLRGRYFIDLSKDGSQSYLHIDEAIRFQGPGTLKSFRVPAFLMVGNVREINEKRVKMKWVTKDDYRRDMVYEQVANFAFNLLDGSREDVEGYVGQLCCIGGSMNGLDAKRDWVANGLKLC